MKYLTYLFIAASLTISAFAETYMLSWDRVTAGEPNGYVIYARPLGTAEWQIAVPVAATTDPVQKGSIELADGQWEIAVAARNASKEGALSNIVDTGAPTPGQVVNLKLVATVTVEVSP